MKKVLSLLILLISVGVLHSQDHKFMSYYELKDFLQASPGSFKYGLYGYNNPAATTYLNSPDMLFVYSEKNKDITNGSRWGAFFGNPQSNILSMSFPSTGFGIMSESDSTKSVYDFRYSWGFGNRIFNFGLGIGYSFGDTKHFNRSGLVSLGGIYRPMRQLSVGLQHTFPFEGQIGETVAEIAIRPIGSYPLAFFADAAMFDEQSIKDVNWSAGVSWEVVDGFRINGRYFKDKTISVGVDLSFGNVGFASQSHFDKNQEFGYNSYYFRAGALDRSSLDMFEVGDSYIKMDMKGSIQYLGYQWFDNSRRLMDILQTLDEATKDDAIKGIVLNISGMSANMELLWEIREKLKEFKSNNKKIIIFTDRLGMSDYHFASIADKIIMDPLGAVSLPGYALGRSYHKQLLEDMGIGFQELRFFKYKSAYENFERQSMSDGDKEQRQKLIDDWYEIVRQDICDERNLSIEEFDNIVNSNILLTAKDAVENKLIDTLARWNDLKDIIKDFDKKINLMNSSLVMKQPEPEDDQWGKASKSIAVLYALGACAMDDGIKARALSSYMKRIAESDVGAIVLRVDSPGGDGMASDLVAEVIRKYKGKKPIIVSQGAVAASGGYWLSMDADTIVASPMTITGSIGVIAGWFYNKGLADSLGISTDIVQRGKYADLGYPFTLPLIPLGLPNRNLTEDERQQYEKFVKGHYKDFVTLVSEGRGMTYDEVHEVAQGRVWTGKTAKEKGLVDVLGGLSTAINIAKEKAGFDSDDEVQIIQYPKSELFDLSSLLSVSLGMDIKKTVKEFNALKYRIDNNGVALPMLPIEYLDYVQDK